MARKLDLAKGLLTGLMICAGMAFIGGKLMAYAGYLDGRIGYWILNAILVAAILFFLIAIACFFVLQLNIRRKGWNISTGGGLILVFFALCFGVAQILISGPGYKNYLRGFTKRTQVKLDQSAALTWGDSVFTNQTIWSAAKNDPFMSPEYVSDLFTNVFGSRQRGYLLEGDTQQPTAIFVGSLGRDAYGLVLLNTNVSIEALSSGQDYMPVGPRIYTFHANH